MRNPCRYHPDPVKLPFACSALLGHTKLHKVPMISLGKTHGEAKVEGLVLVLRMRGISSLARGKLLFPSFLNVATAVYSHLFSKWI